MHHYTLVVATAFLVFVLVSGRIWYRTMWVEDALYTKETIERY